MRKHYSKSCQQKDDRHIMKAAEQLCGRNLLTIKTYSRMAKGQYFTLKLFSVDWN